MQNYRVIMKGLKSDVVPGQAELHLAATFRVDVNQVRVLLAQLPATVKSAVAHDRALEYRRAIEQAGGDCVVEAEADPYPGEEGPLLRTTNGHAVIEDGVAISGFECDAPDEAAGRRLRNLASWFSSHVRMPHTR